jgi:hypothetical protein
MQTKIDFSIPNPGIEELVQFGEDWKTLAIIPQEKSKLKL